MLGDRQRDTRDVDFLERIATDQRLDHLAGNRHDWHRVEHRVGEAGDQVRRTRTGGHQADTWLAGGSRVPLGRQCRPLLEADENVVKTRSW